MRRTWPYAAMTKDKGNAADGRFSAAFQILPRTILKQVIISILLLALWHPDSLPAWPKDRSGVQAGTTLVVGVVHDYKGKISVNPTDLRRFAFAFGFPKDSPWRTEINASLLTFTEKPDWIFLLSRYGLGQNFEELPASSKMHRR